MNSFEDKIKDLKESFTKETDLVKRVVIKEELKGYEADMKRLQQYIAEDTMVENGTTIKAKRVFIDPWLDWLTKILYSLELIQRLVYLKFVFIMI